MKKALLLAFCFFASKASESPIEESESPVKCAYFDKEIDTRFYEGPIIVRDVLAPENLVDYNNQRPKELSPFENAFFYVESKVPKSFPRNNISEILISWDENQLSNFNILNKLIASIIATERRAPAAKTYLDLIKELEPIYGPCKEYVENTLKQTTNLSLESVFKDEQLYQDWLNYFKRSIPVSKAISFIINNINEFIPGYNKTDKVFVKIKDFSIEDLINIKKLEEVANLLMQEEFPE